jgi:hypothetical protein
VLRPGGRLVGYDMVDTRASRLMHVGDHEGVRLARPAALRAELERLSLGAVKVRPAFGGVLARFTATKT